MRHLTTRCLALVILLAVSAARAPAQDPRLADRLDAATSAAVSAILESARAADLPTEPLVQRALQGAAKAAPSERIIEAVRSLHEDMLAARTALGGRATSAEIVAGASALHADAPAAALTRLRAARPGQPLTVALATLADLIGQNVPMGVAVELVGTLVERGASDEELIAARRRVASAISSGESPADAARRAVRAPPER